MVVSRLDKSISYKGDASKKLRPEDVDFDANLYEVEILPGIEGIIALGKTRYTYAKKGIQYVPVYLVSGETVVAQLGVYEFMAREYPNLLDEDGDLDISLLADPRPLLYAFVTPVFLRRRMKQSTASPPDNMSSKIPPSGKKTGNELLETDEWTAPNTPTVAQEMLEGETSADAMKKRQAYQPHTGHTWIQRFMRNSGYGIVDNEGRGDCLFAVIRDAFKGSGHETSVKALREVLSRNATEEVFRNFKEQYDMYAAAPGESRARLHALKKEIDGLRRAAEKEQDRNRKKAIVDKAKPLVDEFRRVQREKDHARRLLRDFAFMRGVTSLKKFKQAVKKCGFWGETWAIQTIEQALNVKLIILSSSSHHERDLANILQCGNMVPPAIEKAKIFDPAHYILLDIDMRTPHYKLITYEGRGLFTFQQLPHDIKTLIVDKCLEKGDGIYSFIPGFLAMKVARGGPGGGTKVQTKPTPQTAPEGDETVVFQFYSKSANGPLPGKGSGETIPIDKASDYSELAAIPQWRRVLSNFWVAPFKLDGKRWNSVEHRYHASKFKKGMQEGKPGYKEFYDQFALDSGSELSKDPAMAKSAGGKTGKYKGKQFRPKSIVMDADFFPSGRNAAAMEEAQLAKYTQNEGAKNVLLATKNAKLQHFVRAAPPIVFNDTMRIRAKLAAQVKGAGRKE